jgi:hypothetical protein
MTEVKLPKTENKTENENKHVADEPWTESELSDARARKDEELAQKAAEDYSSADPVDRAIQGPAGRFYDRGLIREAHETGDYVRDGNILYPAPMERPAGANHEFVSEVVEFVSAVNEDTIKRTDKARGLDPHAREEELTK